MQRVPIGVLLVLSSVSAAGAGPTLTFVDTNAWGQTDNGGPFEVAATGLAPSGLGLHGAAAGNYITLCVEFNEFIRQGRTYDAAINTSAVQGGVGGSSGGSDPLDARTAYLYTTFINGTLTSALSAFDGSTFTYGSGASGDAIQSAIWLIEEEISSLASGSLAESLFELADWKVTSGAWSGIGNVRILNLTRTDSHGHTTNHQDQLILIPLPTAAGMGLLGLAFVSIRRRR